jgi:hypothetical protein
MLDHIDERLHDLRKKYESTRDREFYYRFLEAQRLREVFVDDQIRREQDSQRRQRRTED